MGCFFGCFRTKESSSNLIAPKDPAVSSSKNSLSSLFRSDDDDSLQKGEERRDTVYQQSETKQHKDGVKLVKTFGTLLETATEIEKPSEKWKDVLVQCREKKSTKLNSSHLDASSMKLKQEKQPGESPLAVKICEEWFTGSDFSTESPSSCMTHKNSTGKDSSGFNQRSDNQNIITPAATPRAIYGSGICCETSSVSTASFTTSAKSTKPAQFDWVSDGSAFSSQVSSPECDSQQLKQSELTGDRDVTNLSPFSILVKSQNEMQTVGDMSPAYSVSQPVGNTSQWKEFKNESSTDHLRESLKVNDLEILNAPQNVGSLEEKCSVGNDMADEGNLSSWFKPMSAEKNSNEKQFDSVSVENFHCGKSQGDRPILGMVSAYWNEDEPSDISPKSWDGNGIPNSTNKYKEDQKVRWHATPFEERLEKALSEDSSISQRKPRSGTPPLEYHDNEELDTALSHLQSSSHLESVVSF